jgi:roadblock/LC7 domain-containing protein|tara:strand:+ start:150 stop:569 length:420 start_codon:yes stop_codon:yes gene_type:complete
LVLSKILGGGSLVETVGKVIDSVHTSEEEKLAAKTKLKEIEAELSKKQMDINLADAKSQATGIGGIMQRSWRPLIGMSCALAIAWEFVIKQFLVFVLAAFSIQHNPLPELDMSTLFPLVTALLGMAGLRSFEKSKNITK